MEAWLSGAALIDLAIAFLLLEAVVLAVLGRSSHGGLSLRRCAGALLAGLFLLLALKAVVAEASGPWLVACLTAALLAHAYDLSARRSTSH